MIDDDLIVPLGPGKIRDESTSINAANAIATAVESGAVPSSLDEQALKAARKLQQPLWCDLVTSLSVDIFQSSSLDMLSGNRMKMR